MGVSTVRARQAPPPVPPSGDAPLARRRSVHAAVPTLLALLSFAVAFVQRPGAQFVDSRFELSANPSLFFSRLLHLWSGTGDLGHVHAAQSVGYALPMAPFYTLGDAIGLPMWVTQRLWLGTLLALATWGAVRLIDVLYDPRRGVAHVVAGVLFGFNPYVAVFVERASVALLTYVVLPWLLIAAHRGLQEPRRWRWPAFAGLLVALSGGGANITLVIMVVPAAAALLLYEVWALRRAGRDAVAFAGRAGVCIVVASAWWLVPVALSGAYGRDFLSFTEQPEGIWGTNSTSESLRLLGYWVVYVQVGFDEIRPLFGFAKAYLFSLPVVAATLAVPAIALAGLRWSGRWTYAPFFGMLSAAAVLVMSVGFPPGSPSRGPLLWLYYDGGPLQLLRTPYKAAPVLALCLAVLGAVAVDLLADATARGTLGFGRRRLRPWHLSFLTLIPLLFAFPLFEGRAINASTAYGSIPTTWRQAFTDAARSTTPNERIMVLPGELFSAYSWGGEFNDPPLAPALTSRPVAMQTISRYGDPRAAQLLAAVDDRVQQVRLVPDQLEPLLRLMGVGQVIVPSDTVRGITASLDPTGVARALAQQPAFANPAAVYGGDSIFNPEAGRSGRARALPQLRRYNIAPFVGPGIVRVHPTAGATVLDGDAEGIADLAAVGGLDPTRALFLAGDVGAARLRSLVASGARLVLTDSNRRRGLASGRFTDTYGPTLDAGDHLGRRWPRYVPFPSRGIAAQSVTSFSGVRYLRSPAEPGLSALPQYRPFAAMDGRLDSPWVASPYVSPRRRYLEIGLRTPRALAWIDVYPEQDDVGATRGVGISVNGGPERRVAVHRGWNRITLSSGAVGRLRLRITDVRRGFFSGVPGGLAEVRLPGVTAAEAVRLPTVVATEAASLDLAHNDLDISLTRATADDPYRAGRDVGTPQVFNRFDTVDSEPGIEREITLPGARQFRGTGWASVNPASRDSDFDQLAGLSPGWRFESSSRFEGEPIRRASSAFDGDPQTAWIADDLPGRAPWISWRGPRTVRIDRLRLLPAGPAYRFPARIRLRTPGGLSEEAAVGPDGVVRLDREIRTRALRIELVRNLPAFFSQRLLRAVGIAEIRIPGLAPPRPRRSGAFATACGAIQVQAAAARLSFQVAGPMQDLDLERPLRMAECGESAVLPLATGRNRLHTRATGAMRPDHLLLSSPAPAGTLTAAPPGRVVSTGHADSAGVPQDVRLDLHAPAWLVLGEGYGAGWRAACRRADGSERQLGSSTPADGFANGWRVEADCRSVRFSFAPQRWADIAYVVSGVALLAMLGIFLVGGWRQRRRQLDMPRDKDRESSWGVPAADPLRRLRPSRALGLGLLAAGLGYAGFSLRFAAVAGPVTVILLMLGVSFRRLIALATLGLAALLVIYLVDPVPDFPAARFSFAEYRLTAHWVAGGVVWCVGLGCLLLARSLRRRRSDVTSGAVDESPGWWR